jgi:hypothetical protein
MKPFKILRGRGKDTICSIRYKCLKPYQITFFRENRLVKKYAMRDDRYLQIILRIVEYETHYKDHLKLYYNNYTHRISSYEEILEEAKLLDWKCCICNCDIKSEIADFEIDNFLCRECYKHYGKPGKKVDERILESSVMFRHCCQDMMLNQQRGHIRYLKLSEKQIYSTLMKSLYQY